MLTLSGVRHAWPEKAGFRLQRKHGHADYTFVHFFNSVELELHDETIQTASHACILYRPGTPQIITSQKPLLHDWFHFNDVPETLFQELELPLDTLLYPQQYEFLTELVHELEREFFSRKHQRSELIAVKITELLIKLKRACSDEPAFAIDPFTASQLKKLRSDVLLSLHHPWTVSEMASRIPLSESRFYTVYRSFYGRSPFDDLIHARIDAAKHALLFSDQPISSIAANLGYNNVTHFIRQFHRFVGRSPAQYRKSGEP